jgi:hypothetical protein
MRKRRRHKGLQGDLYSGQPEKLQNRTPGRTTASDRATRRGAQRARRRLVASLVHQDGLRRYMPAVRVRFGARIIVSVRAGKTRPRARILARIRALATRAAGSTPWPGGRAHLASGLTLFHGRTIRYARLTPLAPLQWFTPSERRLLAAAAGRGGWLGPAGIAAIMNANLRDTVIKFACCDRLGGPAAWMDEYRAVLQELADFKILSPADIQAGDTTYASGRIQEWAPITGAKVRGLLRAARARR